MPVSALEWSVPLTFLLCGFGLVGVARMGFPTLQWGRALLLIGTGYGLMLVHTRDFSAIKPLVEDLLILSGGAILCQALGHRFQLRTNWRFEGATIALSLGMAGLSLALARSVRMETFFIQLGCAALLVRSIWRIKSLHKTRADRLLYFTFVAIAIILSSQCIIYLFVDDTQPIVGAWRESFWGKVLQYTGLVISVPLSFVIMLAISLDVIDTYREHAHVDPLTRLFNRRGLEAFFTARQNAPVTGSAAIFLADIDSFKNINDRFGHQVGDMVIAGFAALLHSHVGAEGCAARLGGEEFIAVLPNTPLARAVAIAEEARQAFKSRSWPGVPADSEFTVSFGVTLLGDGDTITTAIARADEHLYIAKQCGRNRVVADGHHHLRSDSELAAV